MHAFEKCFTLSIVSTINTKQKLAWNYLLSTSNGNYSELQAYPCWIEVAIQFLLFGRRTSGGLIMETRWPLCCHYHLAFWTWICAESSCCHLIYKTTVTANAMIKRLFIVYQFNMSSICCSMNWFQQLDSMFNANIGLDCGSHWNSQLCDFYTQEQHTALWIWLRTINANPLNSYPAQWHRRHTSK